MNLITDEIISVIISREENTDLELLDVVKRYIYDRKKVYIPEIRRPSNIIELHLMHAAYDAACLYFTHKLKK